MTLSSDTSSPTMFPPILAGAGTYEFVDRGRIERNKIDWSLAVEKQDHDTYVQATRDAEESYRTLYDQLSALRQFHIDSMVSKARLIPAAELTSTILEFKRNRDL